MMGRFLTAFSMAWSMFSAIPCPFRRWEDSLRPLMLVCFPQIGLLIGVLWMAAAQLAIPSGKVGLFGAALLAMLPLLLTGFLHLDGFMDCCDAIFSRRNLSERQRILKDSHVGAFAVICLVILLLLETGLFSTADLSRRGVLLCFLPWAARCPAAVAVMVLRPMDTSSYAGSFQNEIRRQYPTAVVCLTLAAVGLPLIRGVPGLCAGAAAAGSAAAVRYGVRQLGGMSGDISGFAVTLGEFCGLLALTFL